MNLILINEGQFMNFNDVWEKKGWAEKLLFSVSSNLKSSIHVWPSKRFVSK